MSGIVVEQTDRQTGTSYKFHLFPPPCCPSQVLHTNQWALSNDFLAALGSRCHLLTEFCIPHMQPQVFMSDEPLFECFFDGLGSKAVWSYWGEGGEAPPLSFPKLKVVDMLYWNHSQRFIQMLARFYPSVRLRDADTFFFQGTGCLAQPFLDVGATVPAMGLNCLLPDIVQERLGGLVRHMPYLRELRIQVKRKPDPQVGPTDRTEEMENAGGKLERLVAQMAAFESLAVSQESLPDALTLLRPALRARGEGVTSLLLCDVFRFEESAVCQLLNLCPCLCVLVLTLPLGEMQSSVGTR